MFAGSVTGGIPGSGTDTSDTGPATCQVTVGLDAERVGEARSAAGWVAPAGAEADAGVSVCDAGRKITAKTATTPVTIRNTPPSQARRRVCRSTSQLILSMPIR